jgi:RimJ/RimL family protein N-acetyltransferase
MQLIDVRGALDHQQVKQKLQQEIERQHQHGVQYWKVLLRSTGETIGCCGLRPYHLERRIYEIGVHIMSSHWGKGYATEAARGVIHHAFEVLQIPKLFAGHNPNNTASRSILLKLGFKYIGDQFYPPTGLLHPSYELERDGFPVPPASDA